MKNAYTWSMVYQPHVTAHFQFKINFQDVASQQQRRSRPWSCHVAAAAYETCSNGVLGCTVNLETFYTSIVKYGDLAMIWSVENVYYGDTVNR